MSRELELRLAKTEDALKEAIKKVKHYEFETKQLRKDIDNLSETIINTQPILGRLIAGLVVLEEKGIVNVGELNKVQEETAEKFLAATRSPAPQEVRDRSEQGGTVASDTGNGSPRISGDQSTGGSPESGSVTPNGTGAVIIRLSDVRAAREASNGATDSGSPPKDDLPSGQ